MQENHNTSIFLQRATLQTIKNKFFSLSKLKKLSWRYVINEPNGEEVVKHFTKKTKQKTKQINFRIEKVIRKQGD